MDFGFFILTLVGVIMVIHWQVINDKAGNRGATHGFFEMRDEENLAQKAAAKAEQRAGKPGPHSPLRPARPGQANPAARPRRAF